MGLHFVKLKISVFRWRACIGLLSLAIIPILSRVYGYLGWNVHTDPSISPEDSRSGVKELQRWMICRNWCNLGNISSDKGCIVHDWAKPAVSRFGVLARVLSLFHPPTQVVCCSHEMCSLQRPAGNLSMICAGDCHCVGRLGRSASPHTAASDYR